MLIVNVESLNLYDSKNLQNIDLSISFNYRKFLATRFEIFKSFCRYKFIPVFGNNFRFKPNSCLISADFSFELNKINLKSTWAYLSPSIFFLYFLQLKDLILWSYASPFGCFYSFKFFINSRTFPREFWIYEKWFMDLRLN